MKVGDLVNNTHETFERTLGIIVEIKKEPTKRPPNCIYKVQWTKPQFGCPRWSWNSGSWLEVVAEHPNDKTSIN